jgi:hypothetical protein
MQYVITSDNTGHHYMAQNERKKKKKGKETKSITNDGEINSIDRKNGIWNRILYHARGRSTEEEP